MQTVSLPIREVVIALYEFLKKSLYGEMPVYTTRMTSIIIATVRMSHAKRSIDCQGIDGCMHPASLSGVSDGLKRFIGGISIGVCGHNYTALSTCFFDCFLFFVFITKEISAL